MVDYTVTGMSDGEALEYAVSYLAGTQIDTLEDDAEKAELQRCIDVLESMLKSYGEVEFAFLTEDDKENPIFEEEKNE
tara:strand:+ start:378 stop:611 length:234 start_codon:yes stop_codon:yes gene_type:complete